MTRRVVAVHMVSPTRFEHCADLAAAVCGAGPLVSLSHDVLEVDCRSCLWILDQRARGAKGLLHRPRPVGGRLGASEDIYRP